MVGSLTAPAAQKVFDFDRLNLTEAGFRSSVAGEGKAGDWKIVPDREHMVLGQFSQQRLDNHFSLLIYDTELFDDFVLNTRFKIVAGQDEQMAGIAFRIHDEKNFYYIRASAPGAEGHPVGREIAFFRVINGQLVGRVTAAASIQTNVWNDLRIECKADEIRAALNGQELLMVIIREQKFGAGKIGFWTKSDSIALFDRTTITYEPKEMLAQKLIKEALERYPRVRQLKIFANRDGKPELSVIAGSNPADIGHPGKEVEKDVIARNAIYYGVESDSVLVTFPLHDANGEAVAAVKVVMKAFPGQTEKNAIHRALPIVKQMETRVRKAADLWN